jgi:hypothetical protein
VQGRTPTLDLDSVYGRGPQLEEKQLYEVWENGQKLGPVGSRIVAETFVGLIEGSRTSILADKIWRPTLPALASATSFTMADLLLFVDDLNPLEGPRG